jgi:riboflavin kinase / FMN adenylyltransferase
MKVTYLQDAQPRPRRVAVGTFDGVHLGHREVIRESDTVLTFEPHPLAVVKPDALPKLISSYEIKRDLIAGLGVQELVVIQFDEEFSKKPAEQFIDEVLVERLRATHVSVGENFTFGQKARGTPQMLAERSEFGTRVVPLVEVHGETVSSSRIRGLVAAGEVKEAADFLGGPFLFQSEVVHGDKRGRELGFPTANLVPRDELVVPGHGVYAAWAHGQPAAVNVGVRPTFQTGRGLLIEAFLLDFDADLYGEQLRVAFVERLRGEKRFDSVDDLVAQMELDVQRAREICSATVFRR